MPDLRFASGVVASGPVPRGHHSDSEGARAEHTKSPSRATSKLKEPATQVPRGRLLFVEDVRREVFNDRVTALWVRRNVAPAQKLRLGQRTIAWYEEDVWMWVSERKGR